MENLIVETKDIIYEFANVVLQKDTELIESLLSYTVTFEIQVN